MATRATAKGSVPDAIFAEVRAFCLRKADPSRARRYARYFTEGYDAYGLDHRDPEWESNRLAWSGRLRDAGPLAFLDAGDLLVRTGKYEEASFAILFAKNAPETYSPVVFDRLGDWFDGGIRNWGHTDVLCGEVLTRFITEGIVDFDALEPWVKSPHKYMRRAVPVMLIKALEGRKDLKPFFRVIEPLMHDEEKVVQQGTGWFLREAWKHNPKPVEAFLLKHKETGSRVIYQYATEKMTPKEKERFRRSKRA